MMDLSDRKYYFESFKTKPRVHVAISIHEVEQQNSPKHNIPKV